MARPKYSTGDILKYYLTIPIETTSITHVDSVGDSDTTVPAAINHLAAVEDGTKMATPKDFFNKLTIGEVGFWTLTDSGLNNADNVPGSVALKSGDFYLLQYYAATGTSTLWKKPGTVVGAWSSVGSYTFGATDIINPNGSYLFAFARGLAATSDIFFMDTGGAIVSGGSASIGLTNIAAAAGRVSLVTIPGIGGYGLRTEVVVIGKSTVPALVVVTYDRQSATIVSAPRLSSNALDTAFNSVYWNEQAGQYVIAGARGGGACVYMYRNGVLTDRTPGGNPGSVAFKKVVAAGAQYLFTRTDNTLWISSDLSNYIQLTLPSEIVTIIDITVSGETIYIEGADATGARRIYLFLLSEVDTDTVERHEVTDDFAAWQDLVVEQERVGNTGVYSAMTAPAEFVGNARDIIRGLIALHGIHAQANFEVWRRDNWDIDLYTKMADMRLDFQTYRDYAERVSLECNANELLDYWNSKGKVKYDIPVIDVADPKGWQYQRMDMLNRGKWTPVQGIGYYTGEAASNFVVGLFLNSVDPEMVPGTAEHDFKTQEGKYYGNLYDDYFFMADPLAATSTINFKFALTIIPEGNNGITAEVRNLIFAINRANGTFTQLQNWIIPSGQDLLDIRYDTTLTMSGGDKLCLYSGFSPVGFDGEVKSVGISNVEYFEIDYIERGAVLNNSPVAVINPLTLLQRFLDLMTELPGKYTGAIEWKESDAGFMLCAADSIRNFPTTPQTPDGVAATLHGSPTDFATWMSTLGYEREFDGKTITFKPRDILFPTDVTALELAANEMTDLAINADGESAYTVVEVGYEKQDYESANGKFEANGTFQYTTGYINADENRLSLISPYRADPIGIELLCWERDKFTTDTKSDNDVFVVDVIDAGDHYEEYRGMVIEDRDSGIQMFNARLNPYYLVMANASLIGVVTQKLRFVSTDMSKTAWITDPGSFSVDIYADHAINAKLYEPFMYTFRAGTLQQLPAANVRNGLVYFQWRGELLKGFIKRLRRNEAKEQATEWELYMVK